MRYLPSNPDTWTTISGSGTDICRMHAGNTHGKPRAARCDFCPMHPCRVPHTPRCRTDRWFWHVGAAAAIFIEFVWRIATNGRAQSVRTPGRPRAPLGPPVELVSPFLGFGSDARGRHADVCAHPNRRPRSVTARYQRPAGCLGSPGIPAGPGGPTPPLPPLFTWPRGPRTAQNGPRPAPGPLKWHLGRSSLLLTTAAHS